MEEKTHKITITLIELYSNILKYQEEAKKYIQNIEIITHFYAIPLTKISINDFIAININYTLLKSILILIKDHLDELIDRQDFYHQQIDEEKKIIAEVTIKTIQDVIKTVDNKGYLKHNIAYNPKTESVGFIQNNFKKELSTLKKIAEE